MYINYEFRNDGLWIEACDENYRDSCFIPREKLIEWLGLKDMLDAYNLSVETAEKL